MDGKESEKVVERVWIEKMERGLDGREGGRVSARQREAGRKRRRNKRNRRGVEEKRAKRALEKAGKKRPIRTKRVERKWSR